MSDNTPDRNFALLVALCKTPNATLAYYLDPDGPGRMTPREALRAVGHYLDRERPVATPWTPPGRGWVTWHGSCAEGPPGVPRGAVVEWIYRYEREARRQWVNHRSTVDSIAVAGGWVHDPDDSSVDIVAYRIVSVPAGPIASVATAQDPTTIDVSGTGLPGIVVDEDGDWCWGETDWYAGMFDVYGWWAYGVREDGSLQLADGPETGPEARRLAFAALERYVDSKRGDDAQ